MESKNLKAAKENFPKGTKVINSERIEFEVSGQYWEDSNGNIYDTAMVWKVYDGTWAKIKQSTLDAYHDGILRRYGNHGK